MPRELCIKVANLVLYNTDLVLIPRWRSLTVRNR